MEIVYAAHTKSGVFMLDQSGVCRWAVAHPGRTDAVPERIVGAQYLATLDLDAEGALVDLPRIGCPMLFAATDESGRIRLVRTPPLLRFEDRRAGPARRPLASKFEVGGTVDAMPTPRAPRAYDDELTPVAPSPRSSSIPPPPSFPPESIPVPLARPTTGMRPTAPRLPLPNTPLPPPPRARIVARIPPAPGVPLSSTGSSLRAATAVQSIPVRTRAANMSLKKLARGK